MVLIPGGTFHMGSDKDLPREWHGGEVTVASFCMDRHEVTAAEYAECVSDGGCTPPRGTGKGCSYGRADRGNHPINCVDWKQATTYCESRDKRLPAEQEWEYAARGGAEERRYPFPIGSDAELCWNRGETCPVGSYPSSDNRWGVADLAGNVWEWTASRYCKYPLPSTRCGLGRSIRGGGWNTSDYSRIRGSHRDRGAENEHAPALGFRCVADIAPERR